LQRALNNSETAKISVQRELARLRCEVKWEIDRLQDMADRQVRDGVAIYHSAHDQIDQLKSQLSAEREKCRQLHELNIAIAAEREVPASAIASADFATNDLLLADTRAEAEHWRREFELLESKTRETQPGAEASHIRRKSPKVKRSLLSSGHASRTGNERHGVCRSQHIVTFPSQA
jgi:hypothetical protein